VKETIIVLSAVLAGCATTGRTADFGDLDEFSRLECPSPTHHVQDGLVESCRNDNGVLHGREIEWERPGQKKTEGEYDNGKRSGRWVLWYRNGVRAWERTYSEGQLIREETFYEDGHPFSRIPTEHFEDEGFPKDVIHRVIDAKAEDIHNCYVKALVESPGLTGMLAVRFTIGSQGEVEYPDLATSTMENSPLEECIIRLIAHLEFPRPRRGGIVRVKYPFVFPAAG
jgi:hypothetical protein